MQESALSRFLPRYKPESVLPERLHLTVPPTFRKSPPPGVVLHRGQLAATELQSGHGFQMTGIQRTLEDTKTSGESADVLEQAAEQALQTGAISPVQAAALLSVAQQGR